MGPISPTRDRDTPNRPKGGRKGEIGEKGGKPLQRAPSGKGKGAKSNPNGGKRGKPPVLPTPFDQVIRTRKIGGDPFWALVSTHGGKERWAQLNIERQGMETYLPMCRDPKSNRIMALFPGYIFVRVHGPWYSLRGTFGVRGIMVNGDIPERIPDKIIEGLRQQERGGLIEIPTEPFKRNQKVLVAFGFLSGEIVIYDGLAGSDRVRVLLDFMGRRVRAEVPLKSVKAVPHSSSR